MLINILFALNVHSHNAFSVPGPNSQVQVPGPRCPDISAIAQGNFPMSWHHDKTTRPWHAAGKMVVRKQLSMNTLISLLLSSIATQLVRFFAGRLSFAQVVQLWRFWYIRGCARYQPHTCFLQQRVSVHYRATSRQDACLPCPGFCHGFHSLSKIITTGHHSFAILLVDLTLMTECTQQVCRVLCTH